MNRGPYLVRLRPRPKTLHISQGRSVFESDRDGLIPPDSAYGFFVHETRLLSRYEYLINETSPQPIAVSSVRQHSFLGYYVAFPPDRMQSEKDPGSGEMEEVSEHTIELRVSRYVGGGLHEDLDLTNFTQQETRFTFSILLAADFMDRSELHSGRQQFGKFSSDWRQNDTGDWELAFDYIVEHEYDCQGESGRATLHRGALLRFAQPSSTPHYEDHKIVFDVTIGPKATWHTCVDVIAQIEDELLRSGYSCRSFDSASPYDSTRDVFLQESACFRYPTVQTLTPVIAEALGQAKDDLASLRLHDLDHDLRAWTMAAGLPIYVSLFGRDTLTSCWQAAILGPEMMKGTLPELARWQGTTDNPWRDEQPGKMLHEAHTGPLALLRYNPRDRYYGAITTSAFYPVVVSELWHWTGDKELVAPLLEPALRAINWLDTYADLRSDGFHYYRSRSRQGNRHQGWKDSGDAVVYEDGSQVEPPIATCEEQGFAYAAKLQFAEVLWWFDRKEEAKSLYHEAEEFKKRFNERFWMADRNFVAFGIDSFGTQIKSIVSNAGHCIATGILDSELVRGAADRLFQPDMFSGWGIRTLSSEHPAYNPYSYHRGSIWPVEHGAFAIGFMRYGLFDHLHRMSQALFEAARLFEFYRLPEVFAGHPRDDDHPFPAIYPKANSPQAWSASALFLILQSTLGIYPFAPLRTLIVDPHLPEWMPELTITNLRVGEAAADLRFFRKSGGASDYEVLDKRGDLHVFRQPSPWSQTAGMAERLKDMITSLLPGK
jgi:glycogen debranching enzyme